MAKYSGESATLSYSTDGTAYTDIAGIISISGPSWAVAEIETTCLDSTATEYLPSVIPESGTLDFSIGYDADDTSHSALTDLMATPAVRYWKVGHDSSKTITGQGFLTKFNPTGMEKEGFLTADCSLRFTGGLTLA